jgi:nicotinate-nucleotide pyrophosphorylase (carboxylating)
MGGGVNHRIGLSDGILLKENHIAVAGGVKQALDKAHSYAAQKTRHSGGRKPGRSELGGTAPNSLPVQVEVRDERELREALDAGADAVLLDNMTPDAARRCVELARSKRRDCIVEISGGITLENARAYAETGADFLSSGALTHSAPAADVSLLVDSIDSPSR